MASETAPSNGEFGPPAPPIIDRQSKVFSVRDAVDDRPPPPAPPANPLRIAAILSARLYEILHPDAQVVPVTPRNWRAVLDAQPADLLLVEPCDPSVDGGWSVAPRVGAPFHDTVPDIVAAARARGWPTALWLTGRGADDLVEEALIRAFDHVFYCDRPGTDRALALRRDARRLDPCIQPAIHNPMRSLRDLGAAPARILLDGWSDVERFAEADLGLAAQPDLGVRLIDSAFLIHRARARELSRAVLGSVTPETRRALLRRQPAHVTPARSLQTHAEQEWRALEAAGCGAAVIDLTAETRQGVLRDLSRHAPDPGAAALLIKRYTMDKHMLLRAGHLAWRAAHTRHSAARRLDDMRRVIGADGATRAPITVAMVCLTRRPENADQIIATFERQVHAPKALVVVLHGASRASFDRARTRDLPAGAQIIALPADMGLGVCMNVAVSQCDADYVLRYDDDDIYGAFYASDIVLHLEATAFPFFGKAPSPVAFGASPEVWVRRSTLHNRYGSGADLASGDTRLGGNSLGGARALFAEVPFPEKDMGALDTVYLARFAEDRRRLGAVFDAMNCISVRDPEGVGHTWRATREKLLQGCDFGGVRDDWIL